MASNLYRFAVVNVFALAVTWLISVGLARYLFPAIGVTSFANDVAHYIGVLAAAVTSCVGHRLHTFRKA